MEAEADVILTGDAAIEALAKHLYDTQLKRNSGSSVLNFVVVPELEMCYEMCGKAEVSKCEKIHTVPIFKSISIYRKVDL